MTRLYEFTDKTLALPPRKLIDIRCALTEKVHFLWEVNE